MTLAYLVLRFLLVGAQVFVNACRFQILLTPAITTHGISPDSQSCLRIVIQMNLLLGVTNGTVNFQEYNRILDPEKTNLVVILLNISS